jgi:hypothetical protein
VALGGESVEERVGCRVVRLSWAAEYSGGGGEEREYVEVGVLGEVVEVECAVDFRAEYGVESLWCQCGEDAVVEYTSGVDNSGEWVFSGDVGDYFG